ncbi:MAG: family lipase [Paenibacillaceae bacterium]|jgi:hypothetical protein|nr:family lipase [Paenibacillaceae bacterium]
MERLYTYEDQAFEFEGSISVERLGELVRPWRIPCEQGDFFPELYMEGRGASCSGVRLVFATDAERAALELADVREGMRMDLYCGGRMVETMEAQEGQTRFPLELGRGYKQVAIWLDQRYQASVRGIWADERSRVRRLDNTQKKWIHYGSSISQAGSAQSPSMIWAAIAAREAGLNLTNLGFGGRCILAPMMGRLIRDLPCDLITLKLGINVHGGRLGELTYTANAIGLIALIREKHPDTPLLVISPVFGTYREEDRVIERGLTLQEMRTELEQVVQTFRRHGDRHMDYLSGLDLFGEAEADLLPDGLHPNALAQPLIASRILPHLKRLTEDGSGFLPQ